MWYVQLDCEHKGIDTEVSCRGNIQRPCCNLQNVLQMMKEEDTVHLLQASMSSKFDMMKEIRVSTLGNVTFKSQSKTGIWNVHLIVNSRCSQLCTFSLKQSLLHYSQVNVRGMNVLIDSSIFEDSFASFHSDHDSNVEITNTKFFLKAQPSTKNFTSNDVLSLCYIHFSGSLLSIRISNSVMYGQYRCLRDQIYSSIHRKY